MQVSWIDADEVRGLIARLEGPARGVNPAVRDLETLPEAEPLFPFDMVTDKPRGVQWQPTLSAPAAPPVAEIPAQPDVSIIREKLRLIRDRACEAGLLSREIVPIIPPPQIQAAPPPVAVLPAPALVAAPSKPVAEAPAKSPVVATARPAPEKSTIAERLDEFAQWAAKLTTSEEIFMLDDHGELLWGSPTSSDLIVCARLAMNALLRSHAATLAQPSTAERMQVAPGKELQLIPCTTRHGSVALALVNPQQVPIATLREALALAINQ